MPETRRVRYIIHTDCKNEADDQYTVAHCLLTPMFDVKGIIAGHFNESSGRFPDGATAKASFDEIIKVTDAMGITGKYPVKMGAAFPMENENTPVDSEGAGLIIEEAMKDDPRPLFDTVKIVQASPCRTAAGRSFFRYSLGEQPYFARKDR